MRITIVRTQRCRFVYDVVNNTADVNLIFCSAQPRKTREPTLNARVLLSLFMRFSRFSSFRFVRFLASLFFIAFAQSPSAIIKPSALHLSIHSHVLDDWNNCFANRYIMDGGKYRGNYIRKMYLASGEFNRGRQIRENGGRKTSLTKRTCTRWKYRWVHRTLCARLSSGVFWF